MRIDALSSRSACARKGASAFNLEHYGGVLPAPSVSCVCSRRPLTPHQAVRRGYDEDLTPPDAQLDAEQHRRRPLRVDSHRLPAKPSPPTGSFIRARPAPLQEPPQPLQPAQYPHTWRLDSARDPQPLLRTPPSLRMGGCAVAGARQSRGNGLGAAAWLGDYELGTPVCVLGKVNSGKQHAVQGASDVLPAAPESPTTTSAPQSAAQHRYSVLRLQREQPALWLRRTGRRQRRRARLVAAAAVYDPGPETQGSGTEPTPLRHINSAAATENNHPDHGYGPETWHRARFVAASEHCPESESGSYLSSAGELGPQLGPSAGAVATAVAAPWLGRSTPVVFATGDWGGGDWGQTDWVAQGCLGEAAAPDARAFEEAFAGWEEPSSDRWPWQPQPDRPGGSRQPGGRVGARVGPMTVALGGTGRSALAAGGRLPAAVALSSAPLAEAKAAPAALGTAASAAPAGQASAAIDEATASGRAAMADASLGASEARGAGTAAAASTGGRKASSQGVVCGPYAPSGGGAPSSEGSSAPPAAAATHSPARQAHVAPLTSREVLDTGAEFRRPYSPAGGSGAAPAPGSAATAPGTTDAGSSAAAGAQALALSPPPQRLRAGRWGPLRRAEVVTQLPPALPSGWRPRKGSPGTSMRNESASRKQAGSGHLADGGGDAAAAAAAAAVAASSSRISSSLNATAATTATATTAARHLTRRITLCRSWRQLYDTAGSYTGSLNGLHVAALLGKMAELPLPPPPPPPHPLQPQSSSSSPPPPAPMQPRAHDPRHRNGEAILPQAADGPCWGDDMQAVQELLRRVEGDLQRLLAAGWTARERVASQDDGRWVESGSRGPGTSSSTSDNGSSSFSCRSGGVSRSNNGSSSSSWRSGCSALSVGACAGDAGYSASDSFSIAAAGGGSAQAAAAARAEEPGLGPRQLATVMSALARLHARGWRLAEEGGLWEAALRAAARWGFRLFNTQELPTLLYAVAKMGLQPGQAWLQAATAAAAAAAPRMGPRELSTVLWALVTLGHRPGGDFMAAWLSSSLETMPLFRSFDLAQALWALARLVELQPRLEAVNPRAAVAAAAEPPLRPSKAVAAAAAAAAAAVAPSEWTAAALQRAAVVLRPGVCAPQDVCNTMWAVARLGLTPTRHWLATVSDALLNAPDGALSRCVPADLAGLLWSLAALGRWRPPAAQLERLVGALVRVLGRCGEQDVANALWALARLRFVPPAGMMRALGVRLVELAEQGAAGPQLLSTALWCCVKLRLPPGPGLLQPLLAACARRAADFGPQSAALLLYALARLRYLRWLPRYIWTADWPMSRLHSAPPGRSPDSPGVAPVPTSLHGPRGPLMEAAAVQLPAAEQDGHRTPLGEEQQRLERQHHRQQRNQQQHVLMPPLRWHSRQDVSSPRPAPLLAVRPFLDAALRSVSEGPGVEEPGCPRLTLPVLLWAVSRLEQRLDADWLRRVLVHTVETLPELDPSEAAVVLTALARLGHQPPPLWLDRVEHLLRRRWLPMVSAEARAAEAARRAAQDTERALREAELRLHVSLLGGAGQGPEALRPVTGPHSATQLGLSQQGLPSPPSPPPTPPLQQQQQLPEYGQGQWGVRQVELSPWPRPQPVQGGHPSPSEPLQGGEEGWGAKDAGGGRGAGRLVAEAEADWGAAVVRLERHLRHLEAVARWRSARHRHVMNTTARLQRCLRVLRRHVLRLAGRQRGQARGRQRRPQGLSRSIPRPNAYPSTKGVSRRRLEAEDREGGGGGAAWGGRREGAAEGEGAGEDSGAASLDGVVVHRARRRRRDGGLPAAAPSALASGPKPGLQLQPEQQPEQQQQRSDSGAAGGESKGRGGGGGGGGRGGGTTSASKERGYVGGQLGSSGRGAGGSEGGGGCTPGAGVTANRRRATRGSPPQTLGLLAIPVPAAGAAQRVGG